jgi:hypothetical protein
MGRSGLSTGGEPNHPATSLRAVNAASGNISRCSTAPLSESVSSLIQALLPSKVIIASLLYVTLNLGGLMA